MGGDGVPSVLPKDDLAGRPAAGAARRPDAAELASPTTAALFDHSVFSNAHLIRVSGGEGEAPAEPTAKLGGSLALPAAIRREVVFVDPTVPDYQALRRRPADHRPAVQRLRARPDQGRVGPGDRRACPLSGCRRGPLPRPRPARGGTARRHLGGPGRPAVRRRPTCGNGRPRWRQDADLLFYGCDVAADRGGPADVPDVRRPDRGRRRRQHRRHRRFRRRRQLDAGVLDGNPGHRGRVRRANRLGPPAGRDG